GADHYSILGTHTYPYHQFDVVPNGVYTPSEHDLEELKNGTINEQELNTRANATLDSYSDWANGNVYCVVVEKFAFNKGLDSWEPTGEPDSYGGYIGFKRAFESLKEEFMTFDPIPAPAPVVAQSKPQPSTGPSM
ncbi:MAG: hypothetical protein RSD49_04870, partial [Hafnia sp.]